ncbi:hypothetical protein F2P56_028644 [Juglans regia]|uniref:GTPase Der n=1 Tax=Juglans regia TaxID=51240 RepID=A0A833U8C2_JUGRE|nr:hypothetical protein F2P56_028644 [Juglans regia]
MSYSWVRDISVRKRHYGLVCLLHARTFLPSRVTGPIQNFLKHNDHLHSIAHSGQAIKMATESLCSGAVINDNQSTSSVSDFSRLILSMRPPSVVQSKAGLCMLAENERLDPDSCNNASGLSEESCVDFRSDDEDGVTGNEVKGMFKKPVDFTKIDINLLPTVIIVGRPNVGKSALFNRAGLHPLDVEVGKWLRRHASGIKLIVAMNKCESVFDGSSSLKAAADEAYRLGFGDPIAISAETGLGMTELYEVLKPMLEDYMLPVLNDGANQGNGEDNESSEVEESKLPLQLAIVGRPNVGKSTLLNTLLQEDRVLVGPEAGLTRDSIREHFEFQGRTIYLVDTAGWLQRTKQEKGPSSLSIVQSRKSLMRAHVVALVLDADEIAKARRSMKHDEVVIARRAVEEGRGLVVIVNKMDLLSGKQNKNLYAKVMEAVPLEIQTNIPQQVTGIPVVFISALEGRGRIAVIRQVIDTYEKWCLRLSTARLNRWLRKVMSRHSWKDQAAQPKIKYFTQVKARPPTFVAFVSGKKQLLDTDLRFLTKSLKEDFDLGGIPIRIMQRSVSRKDTGSASKSGQSSGRSS